ncbi:MAG: hypothetical protein AAF591_20570 [Verrucomicrobiota bacterium]
MRRVALVLVLFAATAGYSAGVTFMDGTFANANWNLNVVSTSGGSITAGQVGAGGNPGSYRLVTNSGTIPPAGSVFLAAYHLNPSFVYDPGAMGAIDTISWSIDYQNFSSGQALQLGFQQGGSFFATTSVFVTTGSGTGSWFPHAQGPLMEGDFGGAPDFSATGAPITFGFRTANSGQLGTFEVGYDNISITVTPVPEPRGVLLVLLASMRLGLRRVRGR